MPRDPFAHIPEPLQSQMRQQYAEAEAESELLHHQIRDFFKSLNDDQLDVLDSLVIYAASSDASAGYLRGQISAMRLLLHGTCTCGKEHETGIGNVDLNLDMPVLVEEDDANYFDKCAEYGVSPAGTPSRPDAVVCDNCGQDYPSLKDRMLRKPKLDGCSGCQIKSAHG